MHLNIDSVFQYHVWAVSQVFYCILFRALSNLYCKFENQVQILTIVW